MEVIMFIKTFQILVFGLLSVIFNLYPSSNIYYQHSSNRGDLIKSVYISPNNKLLIAKGNSGVYETVRIFDCEKQNLIFSFVDDVTFIQVTKNSDYVIYCSKGDYFTKDSIHIIDINNREIISKINTKKQIIGMSLSPDNMSLYCSYANGLIDIYTISELSHDTMSLSKSISLNGVTLRSITITSDNKLIGINNINNAHSEIRIWDLDTNRWLTTIHNANAKDQIHCFTISQDNTTIFYGGMSGTVKAYNYVTNETLYCKQYGHMIHNVTLSQDGKLLAPLISGFTTYPILDARTGTEVSLITTDPKINSNLTRKNHHLSQPAFKINKRNNKITVYYALSEMIEFSQFRTSSALTIFYDNIQI
jgi:WD40 repeat protein